MHKNNYNIFLLLLGCLLMLIIKINAKKEEESSVDVDECRFLNCPTEPLHFKESQPRGTGVIKLEAVCKNKTREIIYRLNKHGPYLSTSAGINRYFSIDNKTGWINSTCRIDREFLTGKSYFDITVTAEGIAKGLRCLKSCLLTIYIDDVNDCPPLINYKWYKPISIDSSSDPFIVDRLTAYDPDVGENARFKYSIVKKFDDIFPFTVDEDSGNILAVGDLRLYEKKTYTFLVNVTDRGFPPLSTTTAVEYTIMP